MDKYPKNNINPFSGVIHIKKNPEGCLPFSDAQIKKIKAGINIVDLKNQLRHHSLDMAQEYLKNLGVLDRVELRNNFPSLGIL